MLSAGTNTWFGNSRLSIVGDALARVIRGAARQPRFLGESGTYSPSVLKVAAIDPDAMASAFATRQSPNELGNRRIGAEAKGLQALLRH